MHAHIEEKLYEYRAFMQNIMVDNSGQFVRISADQDLKDIHRNFSEAIEMTV